MTVLLDLTDQARLCQAVIEKTLLQTEEVKCGGDMGREPNEAARNLLDFHVATLELKRLAGDLHRIAEDMLVASMGDQRRATIDGTTVEIRRAYRRTDWEHSKLATHVALTALGGEVVAGMDVIVDAFLRACRPEWRVTVLKEMGLDDEDYSTRELGRATVSLL